MERSRTAALISILLLLAAPAFTQTQAATVKERLVACLGCHGTNGQSTLPEVPSLGGQPQFYLSVQLYMFRERMRNIEPMPTMLQGASDDDLRRMAVALADLPPSMPTPEPGNPARLSRARLLIQQHRCNFCHNQDFSGEQGAPRLAGQREDYLTKAMREYQSNERRAYDPSMADVMHPLTDADILDLAHYLARFR
jgi:cytochrome c553